MRVAPVVAIAEVKHILKVGGDQYIGEHAIHKHDANHANHSEHKTHH